MVNAARDIFDEISESDPFEGLESTETESLDRITSELMGRLEKLALKEHKHDSKVIANELKGFVRSEIAKIKPVQNVIEKTIEKKIVEPVHIEPRIIKTPAPPPQIIKEVRVEVQKDNRKLAAQSEVDSLKAELAELKTQLKDAREAADKALFMHGGSGVVGIPPPEGNPDNYVLTISGQKAKWKQATGGSGGLPAGTFTINNNTPNYTFDATGSSIEVLYLIVATLIQKLQGDI